MIKELKRVVITGLGAITPLGNSVNEFWKNIVEGKSGVGPITRFDTTLFKTKFAAEVKNFTATDYFEKNEGRKYDLFTQYAVASAEEAIRNADLDFSNLNKNKIGVIWGSGNGGMRTFHISSKIILKEIISASIHILFQNDCRYSGGVISIRHGLRGLNFHAFSLCLIQYSHY
jgi:3-oxoacyl-[acyl-carrier-protein] synthase II